MNDSAAVNGVAFHRDLHTFLNPVAGSVFTFFSDELEAKAAGARHFFMPGAGGVSYLDLVAEEFHFLPDFKNQPYRQSRARQERLARACGCTRFEGLEICDATAGLGRDSLILAACSARVTMVERNPAVLVLLSRLLASLDWPAHLYWGDSREFLKSRRFDVVYLDPMFPARSKSASVRKEIATLQRLERPAGSDESEQLLLAAIEAAEFRAVVKRPLRSEPLGSAKTRLPAGSLSGKTVRFDLYVNQSFDKISQSADA